MSRAMPFRAIRGTIEKALISGATSCGAVPQPAEKFIQKERKDSPAVEASVQQGRLGTHLRGTGMQHFENQPAIMDVEA